jgi:hypothetical protein
MNTNVKQAIAVYDNAASASFADPLSITTLALYYSIMIYCRPTASFP